MSVRSMLRSRVLWVGLGIVVCWLAPRSSAAQDLPTYRLDTGFFTYTGGSHLRITVAEISAETTGKVRISILDEAERAIVPPRTLAFRRGAPAKFDLTLSSTPLRRLRFQMVFLNATTNTPVATVEDVNNDFDLVGTRITCAPPKPKDTPVTEVICPGVVITDLTAL